MGRTTDLILDTTAQHADRKTGQAFRLTLAAASGSTAFVDLTLEMVQWNLRLEYRWGCCGADLVRFADSLERLHATLEGEALFYDLDQVVELTFRIADRGRGRLSVEGRIDQHVDRGIRNLIPLRGFELEQSYVPGIVRDIRQFVSEFEICTR